MILSVVSVKNENYKKKNEKDHADIREFSLANFSTRNSKRGDTAMYCKII